jgi:ABC-type antimicrobial peptide transport system permease subunit
LNLDETVRRTLAKVNPNLATISLHSLDYQLAGNFNQERLIARLTSLFGLLTLILASIGLYGVTLYQVTQRTREIGVRMAFGANRSRVVAGVMRGALIPVALGLALGIPVAITGAHAVAGQLYLVNSYDPRSLLFAALVLSSAAGVAGWIPARRAASIHPTRALRSD